MISLDDTYFNLAVAIVIVIFVFTIIICSLGLYIVIRSPHLRSTTFGDICSVQMISDILLIVLNTVWCISKAYGIQALTHPKMPIIVGIANLENAILFHVLMAVNRYIFIFHATENQKNYKIFKVAILFCFLLASAQSVAGPLLDPNLFVVFSSTTLRWQFATTQWTPFYEAYLEYYVVLIECAIITVLDCVSLVKLRILHRHVCNKKCSTAREFRLLLQSICQLVPLFTVMVFFFYVAPMCETAFLAFLCSTAVWHFGISLDGVIIVVFQYRFKFSRAKVASPQCTVKS